MLWLILWPMYWDCRPTKNWCFFWRQDVLVKQRERREPCTPLFQQINARMHTWSHAKEIQKKLNDFQHTVSGPRHWYKAVHPFSPASACFRCTVRVRPFQDPLVGVLQCSLWETQFCGYHLLKQIHAKSLAMSPDPYNQTAKFPLSPAAKDFSCRR